MKILIGNEIEVYLKSSTTTTIADISGILVEVTEGEIFVQGPDLEHTWVVPRENVRYYRTSSSMPKEERYLPHQNQETQEREQTSTKVFVDDDFIVELDIPVGGNVSSYNDNLVRTLAGNIDVRKALANKIQRSVDCYPGEVYITTNEPKYREIEYAEPKHPEIQNSFSMGSDVMTKQLNPEEMVLKFNAFLKGDKKHENKV